MNNDNLRPARGIINGILVAIPLWAFIYFGAMMLVAIYEHNQPEPEPVCRNEFGHRCE